MSQPLSGPLQPGLRFFRRPLPAQLTAFLTVRLPASLRRQPYRLTTFPACHTTDLGSAYSPAVRRRRSPNLQRAIRPHTFLVDAYQQLWHRPTYEVYQQFTYVNRISQPSPSTPLLLGVSRWSFHSHHPPELPGGTLLEELHTSPLPVTHVFLGYCWSYSRFTTLANAASEAEQ
jgi:hypothetical protein